ncbi:uncharacterized protein PAE49_005277 isoform 1-T2 [Odontesthes bonariensis]
MGSAVERTDEPVTEYLIYRGFTSTLKHLDSQIKTDKEKGFRSVASPELPEAAGGGTPTKREKRRRIRLLMERSALSRNSPEADGLNGRPSVLHVSVQIRCQNLNGNEV